MYKERIPKLETKINKKQKIKMDFSGGQITSDGGLLPLRKFDKNIRFIDTINNAIDDPRMSGKLLHTQEQLLVQRMYQIVAGYEDAYDSNLLRNDPLFKLIAGKETLDDCLGSQPTMTRLENRVTRRQLKKLKHLFVKQYIQSTKQRPRKPIILDCDSTEDTVHGNQQLSLFNGFFDNTCYHPLVVFESESKSLLGAHLRPGNYHPARNAHRLLAPIVTELKKKWHHLSVIIRGDSAFGSLRMVRFAEYYNCSYLFAIGNLKSRFETYTATLIKKAGRIYKKTHKDVILYSSFWYRSRIWKKVTRIRVQVKVGAQGTEKRFLLTNLPGTTKTLFSFYDQRGQCENYIKELKLGFMADRLSCHRYQANYFRFLIHCFAYQLIALFKYALRGLPEIATATIDTLRILLIKVGAVITQKARWCWIRFSSSWPFRSLFLKVARNLNIAVAAAG